MSPDLLPRVSTAHSVEIFDAMNGKERGRRFVVTTQLATAHDLGEIGRYVGTAGGDIPRAALQALDVCLRHTVLQNPAVVPVGRALHFYDETVTSLGGGADLYW